MENSKIEQFRQFGIHDLEQYLFLSAPNEWGDDVLEHVKSGVQERLEERLRHIPPEYLSDGDAFYLLMRKVFQFAEGALWQYGFAQKACDAPDAAAISRSLEAWFEDYEVAETRIVKELFARV
jgi:hypothetical protein